jgi:hypothetical protein
LLTRKIYSQLIVSYLQSIIFIFRITFMKKAVIDSPASIFAVENRFIVNI